MSTTLRHLSLLVLLILAAGGPPSPAAPADDGAPVYYQPRLRPGRTLEPFLPYISTSKEGDKDLLRVAGSLLPVVFPEEKEADKLAAVLDRLSAALRQGPAHVPEALG